MAAAAAAHLKGRFPNLMRSRTRNLFTRALLVAAASQGALHAQTLVTVDGDDVPLSERMLFEGSFAFGDADTSTTYTNFFTEGGAGSGGGAGLGGVFFVNSGASLTLNNVSFKSNTVKGGEGGSPPPANVGGFAVAVIERNSSVIDVPDLAATPEITFDAGLGKYVVSKVNLSNVAPTYKVGNAAALVGTDGVGTIAAINGKELTFTQPLVVADDAVYSASPLIGYTPLDRVITIPTDFVTGDPITANNADLNNALQGIGTILVGAGLDSGTTIESFKMDPQGRVTEVTLSKTPNAPGLGFDLLKVNNFSASQFKAVSDTQVEANATGLGLVVGMVIEGDGVPAGTTVTSITPIPGSSNSLITFSQPVNDGANTLGFKGTLPVVGAADNILRLSGADPRLAVGMGISGTGIQPGTVITAIDRESGLLTLSQDVTEAPSEFTVSNVTSRVGTVLTMVNVRGLAAGMTVAGENIPEGTTIVSIVGNVVTLSAAPEGDVVGLTAFSPLSNGGSLNGMVSTGTKGDNGRDGYHGRAGAAFLQEGEGQDGTNGYNAKDGTGNVGGTGGAGGNGSNGMAFNWSLSWEVTELSFDLGVAIDEAISAATNFDETDPMFPHPDPDFGEMRVKIATAVFLATDLGIAISNLTYWGIDASRGLVGRGGAGGDGGEGGNGDEFFGGGAGGAGGRGGEGGLAITDGGDGGTGGIGGRGGFGAGGGSGGAPGEAGSTGQGADGDKGEGGLGGFGAGQGTDGNGEFGGGGSGFGGAIFIRDGGSVTLTGSGVFEDNATLGGSSNNGGESGQAAGTDIFLMKGANLLIAPGAGHTIRFEGTIADNSLASIDGGAPASGAGATVRFGGGGLVQLNGENTYTGRTQIEGATVAADLGVGIHVDSQVYFYGAGRIGSLVSGANTGSLLTSGLITRRVGTLPHQVAWNGAGGFAAATEDDLVLNFGQLGSSAGQVLKWNTAAIADDSVITFGSSYGQGSVRLLNAIDMNGRNGKFAVHGDKPGVGQEYSAPHTAYLQGKLSNGTIEVGSAGMDGLLVITSNNELTGATINSGVVSVLGRLFKAGVGGDLLITNNGSGAGELILWNNELMLDLDVQSGGVLTSFGNVEAQAIDNSGTLNFGGSVTSNRVVNREGGEIKVLGGMTVTAGNGHDGAIVNVSGATLIQSSDISTDAYVVNDGEWTVVGTPLDGSRKLTSAEGLFGIGNVTLSRATYTLDDESTVDVDANLELSVGTDGEGGYYQGVISGPGSLTKSGSGWQTLAGANTFNGDLTVAAGSLALTGTQADAVDVIVRSGASLYLQANDKVASVTVDAGGIVYQDADIETSGGYANNGTTTVLGSRTLKLGAGLTGSGTVSLTEVGEALTLEQAGDTTYSGSIAGIGGLVKTGDGKLTLSGSAGSVDLGGGLTIDGGTVALDGAGILDADLDLVINTDGTLELVNGDQRANSISGLGTIDLGDGNTLEVNVGGDFEGEVTGSGVLKVAGGSLNVTNITSTSGTFNVAGGANTNVGAGGTLEFPDLTVQSGGTLHLGAAGTDPGTSNVNVSGAANIYGNVTGTGSINGNSTTHAGANIAPGNSPGILNFAGNLTVNALTNFDMELEGFAGAGVNPGGHDQVQVGGDLVLNGGTLTIKQLSGFELGRGQKLEILQFGDGRVSGQFDSATSELTNPVFYSLGTGNVVGYGVAGRAGLRAASVSNANQAAQFDNALVETAGGVDQVYAGRLTEALAAAVQAGQSTDAVFELSSAERHGGILAQARGTLFGALADLPAAKVAGWGVRFSGGSLDSAGSDADQLGYKVGRNTASVHHTSLQPGGALTLSLGLEDGKVTGGGYRAESNGVTLGASLNHQLESVKGLSVGLRAGLSRLATDTSRPTLDAVSTAADVDSQATVLGAGLGYARPVGKYTLDAGLELLAYRAKVDAFAESNVSSLDALDVSEQEDNGLAVVASVGISGKATERLTLGADLRLTSFGGDEAHAVESSVLTEDLRTTVTHRGNGNDILGLGLSAAYELDPKSTLGLGLRFEGDGGFSDGFRADLSYRRNF